MNYHVVISDQAKKDLYRIYSYIFTVLKSKVNANSILKRLYEAIEKLMKLPQPLLLFILSMESEILIRFYFPQNKLN